MPRDQIKSNRVPMMVVLACGVQQTKQLGVDEVAIRSDVHHPLSCICPFNARSNLMVCITIPSQITTKGCLGESGGYIGTVLAT